MAEQGEKSDSPRAEVVGNAFVEQYYLVLHQSPDNVHRFYQDSSELSRPGPDGKISKVNNLQDITEKLQSMDNGNSRVEILTVDSQASYHNGFVVCVSGFLTRNEYGTRKFVQTFFLAPQEKGYFVLNDIFMFVDENVSVEDDYAPANVETPVEVAVAVPSEPTKAADQTVVDITPIPENEADRKDTICPPFANGDVNATEKVVTDAPVKPSITVVPLEKEVVIDAPVKPSIAVDPLEKELVTDAPVKPSITVVPPEKEVVTDAPVKPSITVVPPVAAETHISDVKKNTEKKSYASIVHAMKENSAPFNVKSSRANPPVKSHTSRPVQAAEAPAPTVNNVPEKKSDNADKGHSIFVGRLPMSATPNQLREAFSRFGSIKPHGIQVRSNRPQGLCFGFVEFESSSSMEEALKATDMMVGDSKVNIEEAKKNQGQSDRGNEGRGRFSSGRGGFRNDNFRGRRNFGGRYGRDEFGRRPEFSGFNQQNGEARQNGETYRKVNQNGTGRVATQVDA